MTLLFITIGLGAGVLSGIFGLGGGIVIVPALTLIAKFPAQKATGTSLGAMLLPVGAFGAWVYYRNGDLDLRASMWIALGLIVGVFIGAHLVQHLTDMQLRRAFAVLLAVVAVRLWFS